MAVSRLIASFLWDVKPFDPQTLAAAAALMLGVATVASAVPAHRATRIDPMQALRAQ
jgi:putative ABC transport system permease protein